MAKRICSHIGCKQDLKKIEIGELVFLITIFYIINYLIYKNACLTQLVEYRFCKPKVDGSSPLTGCMVHSKQHRYFFL